MLKKFLLVFLTVFMALGLASVASAAPVTYFDFNGDTLADTSLFIENVGDTFSADIYISGVDDSYNGLISMGLQFSYDYTQVNVMSITTDPAWYLLMAGLPSFDNTAGIAEMGAGKLAPGLTGTILLASVDFECVDMGFSELVMGELYPHAPSFDAFVSALGHVYDKEIGYGTAGVTQVVPIPGAALLLGSGLIGLFGLKRKFRG